RKSARFGKNILICPDEAAFGTIEEGESRVQSLEPALNVFFNEYQYGIIIAADYARAIIKQSEHIYLFDPHPIGANGHSHQKGKATMFKFNSITELCHHLTALVSAHAQRALSDIQFDLSYVK